MSLHDVPLTDLLLEVTGRIRARSEEIREANKKGALDGLEVIVDLEFRVLSLQRENAELLYRIWRLRDAVRTKRWYEAWSV